MIHLMTDSLFDWWMDGWIDWAQKIIWWKNKRLNVDSPKAKNQAVTIICSGIFENSHVSHPIKFSVNGTGKYMRQMKSDINVIIKETWMRSVLGNAILKESELREQKTAAEMPQNTPTYTLAPAKLVVEKRGDVAASSVEFPVNWSGKMSRVAFLVLLSGTA